MLDGGGKAMSNLVQFLLCFIAVFCLVFGLLTITYLRLF
jgi:hypothetical protein